VITNVVDVLDVELHVDRVVVQDVELHVDRVVVQDVELPWTGTPSTVHVDGVVRGVGNVHVDRVRPVICHAHTHTVMLLFDLQRGRRAGSRRSGEAVGRMVGLNA
jgi:hypothetical protein